MRSSTGAHFIALDHVRALAAFVVFTWHFIHAGTGFPVSFDGAPRIFPLALLDEGHVGVALFMTLSGYLFAKLLDGLQIDYTAFLWNRALRLLPLLALVCVIVGIQQMLKGVPALDYLRSVAGGVLLPSLPNGGWSITVEAHFYLVLPLLLYLLRRHPCLPLLVIAGGLTLRTGLYLGRGEVQSLAYWTLIGRIDQFALGIVMFAFRDHARDQHLKLAALMLAFCAGYWLFDVKGGFYGLSGYPSPSPVWVYLPTLEGLAFGVAIAWYDTSFRFGNTGWSGLLGKIGEYSYSIYLLHFFFVFGMAQLVDQHVMRLDNFYLACAWAVLGFLLMLPLGWASYRFIESPFLRHRRPYLRGTGAPTDVRLTPVTPAPDSPASAARRASG